VGILKLSSLILVLLIIVCTVIEFFVFDPRTYGVGQYVGLGFWFILVIIGLYRLDRWWNRESDRYAVFRFAKKRWRNYQINRAREERIRQHYIETEREGRAFGHGTEVGRMQAREQYRQQRRMDRAWSDTDRNMTRAMNNTDRNVTRALNKDYDFLDLSKKKKKRN
jgi:hypothetical protein